MLHTSHHLVDAYHTPEKTIDLCAMLQGNMLHDRGRIILGNPDSTYLVQFAAIHDYAHCITDVPPPASHLHTVLEEVAPLNLAHVVTSHQCAFGQMERNPATEWSMY